MTILEALERAKLLRKNQQASQIEATRVERSVTAPLSTVSQAGMPEFAHVESAAAIHADLQRVKFDANLCEANHIRLSEERTGDSAPGDASYRMLRSRVQHKTRAAGWSVVGITSPGPGEGKTVTAMNLAICIAREKQRPVYLLDLDMRNPSVMQYGGIQLPQSLSLYFAGALSQEQVLFATSVDSLFLAGSRDPVPNASEMLATPRLSHLFEYIRRRSPNALVIIDLPPVTSTDEALVVAPQTDAMFMVVSEGRTRRDGLKRALDLLGDFNVAGIILNRSSEHLGSDYYGY